MASQRQLADAAYRRLLEVARSEGAPVEQMRRVLQRAGDIGRSGFP